MNSSDWKNQDTQIAIFDKFDKEEGEWQYFMFDTWKEAREAVNAARREGKAAVFYDGATLPSPPELFNDIGITSD